MWIRARYFICALALSCCWTATFPSHSSAQTQTDPSRQVVVYFLQGIQRTDIGQPPHITSPAIQATLDRFQIDKASIGPAHPFFNEADTLKVTPDGRKIKLMNYSRVFVLNIPNGQSRDEVIKELQTLNEVLYAEPNSSVSPCYVPEDNYIDYQWAHIGTNGIKTPDAWDIYRGSSSTIIGIVDSGMDATHPDLSGKVSGDGGWATSGDWRNHGMHVAGIAAANTNNEIGVAGVNWYAQLHSQRIDQTVWWPPFYLPVSEAICDAVDYSPNVCVINASWHLGEDEPYYSSGVRGAFAYAYKMNRVSVAAMGNSWDDATWYPAGFGQGIIAVGATRMDGVRLGMSCYGDHIDVCAPGQAILSTVRDSDWYEDEDYDYMSGTSMATAYVSGLVALLKGHKPRLCGSPHSRGYAKCRNMLSTVASLGAISLIRKGL